MCNEPFDLRLTVLRMLRKLHIIVMVTVLGTLVFGGGYYVKNVLLNREINYSATSTYKVSYTDEAVGFGYYINTMTWETYVHTQEFLDAVWNHLQENAGSEVPFASSADELAALFVAKLDSDVHVPSTVVTTSQPEWTMQLAQAVEETMIADFVADNEQVAAIKVIDPAAEPEEILPDARPVRAFVLSAVLSCFFVVIALLLKELGDDGIWLPATLRRRYGLVPVGTLNSPELKANLQHLFGDKQAVAICTADDSVSPVDVAEALQAKNWTAIPAPLLCPEACGKMSEADGILLVVKAGEHTGKSLEYVLEYLKTQDIQVTAALLWDADEWLIRTYYRLPFAVQKSGFDRKV